MKIAFTDPAEFKRLIETLAEEVNEAHEHYTLYRQLSKVLEDEPEVYNFALWFWHLTLTAHIDTALMRLCRAYDLYKDKPCLNLRNFLETVRDNVGIFDEPHFRVRLKDNPYVDSLVTGRPKPTARLQDDLDFVRNSPTVRKLKTWRHQHFAHRSRDAVLYPAEFSKRNPLLFVEIEALIDRGHEIVNHYSHLYDANFYPSSKSKDYERVFAAIRHKLERTKGRIQQEVEAIKALTSAPPSQ